MRREGMLGTLLGIVALGSIWGFFEAITFGGLLHSYWGFLFPYHLCPCFLMAAVFGSLVMGLALAIYRKPSILIGIGLVAASFSFLAVPFLPTSVRSTTYGPVIASATAVIMGSVSLALVSSFLMKRLESSLPFRVGVAVLSAMIASILFIVTTAYGVDKPICADLGYARALPDFLCIGGMAWIVAAATLFPVGYLAGAELQLWLASLARKPSLDYAASAATIVLCLSIGVVAFIIGL